VGKLNASRHLGAVAPPTRKISNLDSTPSGGQGRVVVAMTGEVLVFC